MKLSTFLRYLFPVLAIIGLVQVLISVCGPWVLSKMIDFKFTTLEASSIGIIGGADGPTAVFVTHPKGISRFMPWIFLIGGSTGFFLLRKCTK